MATITLRSVKGSALSHAEMDANLSALNNEKLDSAAWPSFVGASYGDINATNVGGATAKTNANNSLDLEDWSDSTYMSSLLNTLSAGELSVNQRAAIAGVVSILESQISLILSKLDSVS